MLCAVVGLSFSAAQPAGALSKSQKSQQKALKSFAADNRHGLATCEAASANTQILLGEVIQAKTPTQSELTQLDSADKSAQTACDDAKDNNVLNLSSLSVPGSISYIHQLSNVGTNATIWATDDTTAVLHDIQKLVETTSSNTTALQSQLQTDVTQADADAGSLRNDMNSAAKRLKLKSYGGLGLIQWGS
jgi:hypothetical protein